MLNGRCCRPYLTYKRLLRSQPEDVLELDELYSFVGKKKNKRWLWVALCRRTRQVVAFVIGVLPPQKQDTFKGRGRKRGRPRWKTCSFPFVEERAGRSEPVYFTNCIVCTKLPCGVSRRTR